MRAVAKASVFVAVFLTCAGIVQAQDHAAVHVPLHTATGWGAVEAPPGYKALRIQGRTSADPFVLARLFADFASHPAMFPRVVDRVDVLTCEANTLKARYRTKFDSKPGGVTKVESLSTVRARAAEDRIEFTWGSDDVESNFVNAVRGRMLFMTRRTATGTETLIDYVSAVRPRNSVKGVLLESQKSVLVSDARYVIDRLMLLASKSPPAGSASAAPPGLFSCRAAAGQAAAAFPPRL